MRLDLRAKLFLLWVVLVASSAAVADRCLPGLVEGPLAAARTSDLRGRARLVAREAAGASRGLPGDDRVGWDALADSLGAAAGVRVSIVGVSGEVLGDSALGPGELARADSAAHQPEIEGALAAGEATADRPTGPGREPTRFAAVAFRRGDALAGVARVASSLRPIEAARDRARTLVWGGAAVVLALALLLSHLVSRQMTSAVGELTAAARRMTLGDLSVRPHRDGPGELSTLGMALDRLAGSLASTLGQLRAERDLQGRILEAMQEGVVVVDRDGHIVLFNPALRSMLLIGADAVGKLLIEAVRHADLDELLVEARAPHGAPPTEIELPGLKPRRLLVHASPLSGGDDRLLVVFVDVTELRRLESLRRDFVANASHELRTPIAAVRSATETLRDGALSDERAATRFVDIIERNAQRLQSLVEDMLDLSKLESREFRLKRETVELRSVVPIVLALFRERADKKGVQLAAEPLRGAVAVQGDARALEHVLSNLVDNAVKYCPRGSRITVRATTEEGRVRLVVSDTGPGIPPEHLPRLFERFYRVDAGRSRELGGTGLGLSIVKHMVEAMHGTVTVESHLGKGSTFTVWLAAAPGPGDSHEEFTRPEG